MRLCSVVRLSDRPTARALVVEVAVTPLRRVLIPGAGGGTAALVHVLPFQCRARAWTVSLALAAAPTMEKPTAQASLAEVAPTPVRSSLRPGLGLGARAHLVPFQCRIRVWSPVMVPSSPTAQALLAEVAAT